MTDLSSQPDGIAIIIATLGRAEALEVCFMSLVHQTTRPAEVWVVHSGDDVATRALCEREWPSLGLNVRYLAYPRKSAALQRDFAVRRTAQPLILFADDDME